MDWISVEEIGSISSPRRAEPLQRITQKQGSEYISRLMGIGTLTPVLCQAASAAREADSMKNFLEILESRLADGTDVYVNAGVDASVYLAELAEDVRRNECQPFEVSAVVMAPGLPGFEDGEQITGLCVAKAAGRWLVYRPEDDLFYAFWGTSQECLGAHGVFGSPLYCWSA